MKEMCDNETWRLLLRRLGMSALVLVAAYIVAWLAAFAYGWVTVRPNMGRGLSFSEYLRYLGADLLVSAFAALFALAIVALCWTVKLFRVIDPKRHIDDSERLKWSLVAIPLAIFLLSAFSFVFVL